MHIPAYAHPRRWKEPVDYKDLIIGHELPLQRAERRILHLLSEKPLVPAFDVLILYDHELPSRDDIMVYLIRYRLPLIGKSLILPLDPFPRIIPALGALLLAGKLLAP